MGELAWRFGIDHDYWPRTWDFGIGLFYDPRPDMAQVLTLTIALGHHMWQLYLLRRLD